MRIVRLPGKGVRVESSKYSLEIRPQEGVSFLAIKGTRQRYLFFPGGACDTAAGRDETKSFGPVSIETKGQSVTAAIPEESSLWKRKRLFFECAPDGIEFHYELEGKGVVGRAHYFRGYFKGKERGMAGDSDEIYSTVPNHQEKLYFHPSESFSISAGDNPEMPIGGQAFPSPCFCLGLRDRRDKQFLSVGLATEPGQYTWDAFQWNPPVTIPITPFGPDNVMAGGFAAVYDGKLMIDGCWRSPRLVMRPAADQHDVLKQFLNHCYCRGYCPAPPRRKPAGWWLEPIYCTWHDQVAMAGPFGEKNVNAGDFCTRKLVDHWLGLLGRHGCMPGTVILDATWAKNLNSGEPDPVKWPGMRDWIERCHRKGLRVMLWSCAWAKEGLPPEECITQEGKPVACDITNPHYVERFKEMIRKWFSAEPDCLNADGVKLDGQGSLPTGKNLHSHGGVWGLELQRLYMKLLYEEAKRHKPDVCVSTCVLHPYLSEYTDMMRLGDMYTHRLTAHETMLHRAAQFRITMPHAVIDTDGQFSHYILDDYARELTEQAKVGVPTLYTAEWSCRYRYFGPVIIKRLTREDYRIFAKVFAEHRKSLEKKSGKGK